MTRLIWGADGERFFEAGVDRGVLYLHGIPGVPWNGLKAVSEAPSGGSPEPYYIDGMKYANVATAEEFNATLEAYSSPVEFAACDGSLQLAAGLFATQQPRKPFGLTYRTTVGNDLSGLSGGHKIHLVYNALASPSGRSNNSLTQSIDPLSLSWSISTKPPVATGYKATAHLVIETRELDPSVLLELEDALYGNLATTASLPTQAEIIALLS
jgi:hypothetical protein